jgi:hypothetical protein
MSDKQPPAGNPFDPAAWREGRDVLLDAWAKTMVNTVNTDQYAKATGAMLDSYLSASSPFREVVEKSMQQVLQQLSMPSRNDFIALAERITNIEMRLDDMDAKLDRLVKVTTTAPAARRGAVKNAKKKKPRTSSRS